MARPKPPVLFTLHLGDILFEIMQAQSVWIVEYQGRPISGARTSWNTRGASIKYIRTNFSNPAHAYRLAEKLNNMFDTNEFTVKEINT